MADSPRFPLADDRAVAQDGLRDAPEAPVGAGHPAAAGARDDARPALSRGQTQAYLARIGFAGTPRADRTTLDAIVARHQMSVPFETIGLHRGDAAPPRRQVELELCEAVVEEQDFDALNLAFSSPGTLFRDHELANLRTPRGYVGLRDGLLTIREDSRKTVVDLPDGAAVDAALRERFGLRY